MSRGALAWIARRRVALGFAAGIGALVLSQPTHRSVAVGALVAMAGEAVRIWAAGHLEKGREVTTSGPYRLTRHPLYVGSSLIGAGLALASASIWVAGLVAVYLGVTLTAAVKTEEAHLTAKFGESYPAYRDGRGAPAARRFSAERVMRNREYRAVAGVAAVLAFLFWRSV